MAVVKIDIHAMAQLVRAVGKARTKLPTATSGLRSNLSHVWLSSPSLDKLGGLDAHLETAERDLNRRLALARIIEKSMPGIGVVTFDDKVLSKLTDAQIKAKVARILELIKVDDENFGKAREIDPELVKLLQQGALDPYFAKVLAQQLDPETLRRYLYGVNVKRFETQREGEEAARAFDKKYDELLRAFGMPLGLASQGTGSLAVPGMAKQWADYIRDKGKYRGTGAVSSLSLVIERGQWSDDFLVGVYKAVRDVEGSSGVEQWAMGQPGEFMDPNPQGNPHSGNDPMFGILTALKSNPSAMATLFTGGETTTISVGGKDTQVNKELWSFIRDRGEITDETFQAFMGAITSTIASPPKAGGTPFQALLAVDLKNIGQAIQEEAEREQEKAGPLWKQIAHTILDLVGMIPVVGEPVDFINGVWYFADGDAINGALSMGSMIPFAGWAVVGGKWVRRGLKAEELAKLTKLARDGKNIRIFAKDGRVLTKADLSDPATFRPERFLSPEELARWSGEQSFMQKIIAGNRFNYFLNPRYAYHEVPMTLGNKRPFRLDSYTPGQAIVSRKLTQFGEITQNTARGYIDEFVKKYPAGTKIANTPQTRQLGIAGQRIRGPMILEVPPQVGGKIDPEIIKYAESKNIFIRDLNGTFYTKPPK